MRAYLEVARPEGRQLLALEADRVTVGKALNNDLVIDGDPSVSRLHAVLERFPAGWCIRDLASRNGTFVNGQRLFGERCLEGGDEIRVGRTRIAYHVEQRDREETVTQVSESAPDLTPRERQVLLSLCRPVLSGDLFTEPASIRAIAVDLVVTEAAVKQHLLRLYEKFDIHEDESGHRRVRLANAAVRRGAVNLADLRAGKAR